jgi:hypothetical protein
VRLYTYERAHTSGSRSYGTRSIESNGPSASRPPLRNRIHGNPVGRCGTRSSPTWQQLPRGRGPILTNIGDFSLLRSVFHCRTDRTVAGPRTTGRYLRPCFTPTLLINLVIVSRIHPIARSRDYHERLNEGILMRVVSLKVPRPSLVPHSSLTRPPVASV